MPDRPAPAPLEFSVNGVPVAVPDAGDSLLGVLRDHLHLTGAKDGCSPQGQCGCCTVLVDGQPRVACVTPARRIRGRSVTTIEGLDPARASRWGEAMCATGGSQCGFCTPGIILRLEALAEKHPGAGDEAVNQALLAHLCRCTGWQTINEAWRLARGETAVDLTGRDLDAAARRAELEGGTRQRVDATVALGHGGFAADTLPNGALRAVPDGEGGWAVGATLAEARAVAGKTQGRRTTVEHRWPLEIPPGEWDATLVTTWVEPAYLETDAAWCEPGGDPASIQANGGAFGAKATSPVTDAARRLAAEHDRPVLALASREDTVRWGPKRPPVAGGVTADGHGVLRVAATDGIAEAVASVAPGVVVEQVAVAGPATSSSVRAAGWAEALVLLAGARGEVGTITAPNGAQARASITRDEVGERIDVWVSCGLVLDEVVLRSYCIGAAHMAASWIRHEALTVDEDGTIHDLTVRSFGVMRAVDTPRIEVVIESGRDEPVNGSDAVYAAVAAAVWLDHGQPARIPVAG